MLFYFVDKFGNPAVYNVQTPADAWTQTKAGKTLTVLRSSCWMRMGAIGGVEEVPELTEIQISPTKDNYQTIGVKYVVKRNGKFFIGFGSSNDFSVVKKVDTYQNKDGTTKEVVSGNALHSLEMATKRAKVVAIATALGFDHNEVGEVVESVDYIINPKLRQITAIGYKHTNASELNKIQRPKTIGAVDRPETSLSDNTTLSPEIKHAAPTSTKDSPVTASTPKQETSPKQDSSAKNNMPNPAPKKTPEVLPNKAKPEPSKTPPAQTSEDPSEFIMPFGKHKGKALITIMSEDQGYLKWLVGTTDNPQVKSKVEHLLSALPNLAHQDSGTMSAPPNPGSFKEKLKEFWKMRNYDPKTEVKTILEKALDKTDLSYGVVSEAEAQTLYADREKLFPEKGANKASNTVDNESAAIKDLNGKAVCCVCEIKLTEPEIKVSLKKNKELGGRMMCFKHIRVTAPDDGVEKCEKCSKVLDQQELQFIKEYDSAKLCADCQAI